MDQTAPFKLAKDPAQAQRLDEVLYNLAESCRVLAVLLWPFIPGTATKIYAQLGLPCSPDKFSAATGVDCQRVIPSVNLRRCSCAKTLIPDAATGLKPAFQLRSQRVPARRKL